LPVARSGIIWRPIFVVLLLAATASYIWYDKQEFTHGGSKMGIIYGVAGTLLILLETFFGVRKRWYRSTFGTLEQWLQSHIYLGVLVLVILLFHSGGRFNDTVAVTTLIIAGIVVASGIFGAILYLTVPRLLTEVESNLTVDEISDQLNQLARSMARIATDKSPPFQRIYNELLRELRPGWLAGWRLLFASGRRRETAGDWTRLIALVGKEEQEDLRQMLVLSRQRKELLLRLIAQQRYKNILDAWLYIHVPFTVALLLFAIVHIAGVFYYRRIG
jgi:hypothetical protein